MQTCSLPSPHLNQNRLQIPMAFCALISVSSQTSCCSPWHSSSPFSSGVSCGGLMSAPDLRTSPEALLWEPRTSQSACPRALAQPRPMLLPTSCFLTAGPLVHLPHLPPDGGVRGQRPQPPLPRWPVFLRDPMAKSWCTWQLACVPQLFQGGTCGFR